MHVESNYIYWNLLCVKLELLYAVPDTNIANLGGGAPSESMTALLLYFVISCSGRSW